MKLATTPAVKKESAAAWLLYMLCVVCVAYYDDTAAQTKVKQKTATAARTAGKTMI